MSMYLTFTIGKDKRNLVDDITDFHIDNSTSTNPQWLQARQNEDGMRQVFVTVKNEDGSPFNLTDCNYWFQGKLPDGIHKIIDARHGVTLDAQNGKFRFDMPKHAFTVAGSYVQAFFRIVRNGESLTTLEFDLTVLADLVYNDLVPSDYITPFEDLYGKLQDYITKANGDFDAAMTQWKKDVANLITELNADVSGINLTITEIKTQLTSLEDKIKANNLLTQADLDNALADINKQIKDGIDQMNELANRTYSVDTDYLTSANVDPIFKPEVERVLPLIDENKFNLAVNTDAHYQDRSTYGRFLNWPGISQLSMRHYANLTALGQKTDAIIAGGDNMHPDYLNIKVGKKDMELVSEKVLNNETKADRFMILGNHDVGDSLILFNGIGKVKPSDVIQENEVKQYYQTAENNFGEVRNNDSLYFYKDYPEKKIRLIGIETEDTLDKTDSDGFIKNTRMRTHVLSQNQLNWIGKIALLTAPTDYHIVMYGHAPLLPDTLNGEQDKNWNNEILASMIEAFQNGGSFSGTSDPKITDYPVNLAVDFSNRGKGNFVGYFCGHTHMEDMHNFHNFKIVNLMHSICEPGPSNVKKVANTVTEDAETIISVDIDQRKVNLIGFGAATNRTFTY